MKKLKLVLGLCGIVLVIACSCRKDDPETDSAKAFMGKWDWIGHGNWPQVEYYTSFYASWEFYADSTLYVCYFDGDTYKAKYWVDTLLHVQTTVGNGIPIIDEFKYQFKKDTLRLDFFNTFAFEYTYILKK